MIEGYKEKKITLSKVLIVAFLILELSMVLFVTFEKPPQKVIKDRTVIVFWHAMGGPLGRIMKNMIEKFNKSQNEVYVLAQHMGNYGTLNQKLIAAVLAGQSPDIAQAYEAWIAKLIKADVIVPLDKYINGKDGIDKKDIFPAMLENVTVNGKVYSLPFNKSMPVMYYNKDMFRKAGLSPERPPRTWKEFDELCKKFTKDINNDGKIDVYGTALGVTVWTYENFLMQSGGKLISDDGRKALLTSKESYRAVNRFMDLLYNIKVKYKGKDGKIRYTPVAYRTTGFEHQNDFVAQRVAMIESSCVSKVFMKSQISFDLGIAPIVYDKYPAAVMAGTNIVIFKSNEKKQKACWKFIKWFTNTENTAFWSVKTGYMPVRMSALNFKIMKEYYEKNPQEKSALLQLRYAKNEPNNSVWFVYRDILQKKLENIVILKENPEKHLKVLNDELTYRLNQNI